ncbi:MAG: LpxI family protein [Alphaproteobacteria bacterium]|nr:LpxI family protein [Alphaproteobacteria bacterium]
MAAKLGVLAGGGPLPRQVVDQCIADRRPVFVVAFEGFTEPSTCKDVPHVWLRLGQVGALLKALKAAKCVELVMIGPIPRPSISTLRLDFRAIGLLGRLGKATNQGDNALLSMLVAELESEGFKVVGAHEVIDGVTSQAGVLGKVKPDETAERDISIGCRAAKQLGLADIGQAVVVQQGIVLGVEAIEGTDALIERCGRLQQPGPGGVLVKLKKPHQDERADLPTIGPRTIERIAAAGLRGVAVEAGASLMVDRAAVIAEADRHGLFVIGIEITRD